MMTTRASIINVATNGGACPKICIDTYSQYVPAKNSPAPHAKPSLAADTGTQYRNAHIIFNTKKIASGNQPKGANDIIVSAPIRKYASHAIKGRLPAKSTTEKFSDTSGGGCDVFTNDADDLQSINPSTVGANHTKFETTVFKPLSRSRQAAKFMHYKSANRFIAVSYTHLTLTTIYSV